MKHLLILFLLFIPILCLMANPLEFILVSEFWFDSQGLHIELCPSFSAPSMDIPLSSLRFVFNGQASIIPETQDSLFYGNPVVINLSELDPPLYIEQENAGTLYISLDDDLNSGEQISWTSDMPPVNSSFVHWLEIGWHWAIETPPTPGSHPYDPLTRGLLRVYSHDQLGNPLPNVLVFANNLNSHGGETDVNGVYQDTLYASEWCISAYYPSIPHVVYSNSLWLLPNQITQIDVPITLTGNLDTAEVPSPIMKMKIYPVPYHNNQNTDLCFQLPENLIKSRQTILKIYNTKGQYITELTLPNSGDLHWKPAKDIPAGIYTVRLICDNRIMETAHFSLLN